MSGRALSLQAYLATARKGAATDMPALPPRPAGPLVWAYATGKARGRAMADLCARLDNQYPDVTLAISGDIPAQPDMLSLPVPPERLSMCSTFATDIAPDVVLWGGGELRPALLFALSQAGTRLMALDIDAEAPQATSAARWLPDPSAATLALFDQIYATGEAAARRLRRMGLDSARIHAATPLTESAMPLPCPEGLHDELSGLLAGRPVWLAARLRGLEARDVLAAHRQAIRLNHRLLLVIVPSDEDEALRITRAAEASQMRICNWDAGDTPDENTQVMLTEGPETLGLWYRVAPLAFLGGSLLTGTGGENPFEAAALGTAILYGPNVGKHLGSYSRLVEAGAARIVRDADSLAAAVLQLVAPDQAAQMAHAGWDVITSGAELVDQVIADVSDFLDKKDAS
ncbi:3-deoxy-D-manno-octulosonic acid transferase [Sagittula sp. SSi028]|uniref:3-deoxy-D-manno-octulosonic acid transferase n=1 Tax=Sagittula sp. SSi028 TaxID=3400636 RepID=UPI003AF41208